MPDDESWRSHDASAYLDRVQRAGFAWEFLRRNPDYRQDYEDMSRDAASGTTVMLEAALALSNIWTGSIASLQGITPILRWMRTFEEIRLTFS